MCPLGREWQRQRRCQLGNTAPRGTAPGGLCLANSTALRGRSCKSSDPAGLGILLQCKAWVLRCRRDRSCRAGTPAPGRSCRGGSTCPLGTRLWRPQRRPAGKRSLQDTVGRIQLLQLSCHCQSGRGGTAGGGQNQQGSSAPAGTHRQSQAPSRLRHRTSRRQTHSRSMCTLHPRPPLDRLGRSCASSSAQLHRGLQERSARARSRTAQQCTARTLPGK